MPDLHQSTIFLSASFPSGERGERFKPYDPSGIADAVSALARAVLIGNGQLLFGGHPTITPLVLMIARELQVMNSVVVYQSAWFKEQAPPEVDEIANEEYGRIEWTDKKNSIEASLESMRREMLCSPKKLVAAVFVGGMEGIRDEYELVKELSSKIPCIPVTGPGGAAAQLPKPDCISASVLQLDQSRAYPLFALRALEEIEKRVGDFEA